MKLLLVARHFQSTGQHEPFPFCQAIQRVELQKPDGDAGNRRFGHNDGISDVEVSGPLISARMVEQGQFAGLRING